ncbi:MAG: MBL fold metallo-hydrolase [Candidatus Bathyarchaeota archaeon]|nr:MBL fold metallo-hydrolase [Candidatus Bathyarchaeota archaeon]
MAYSNNTDAGLIVPKKWYESLPRPSWSRFEKIETSYPWFEIYETTSETYAIYEDGQFEEVISYLVIGEDTAALVDTGNGIGDIKAVAEELTDLPVIVVNTHAHFDHTGGNWAFEEVALYDHPFARKLVKGRPHEEIGKFLSEDMVWKPLPKNIDPTTWYTKPYKVTKWMKEGDRIDLGGKELKVIHTPGHTPDSVSLLERRERLLFTGDIFYPAPIYIYSKDSDIDEFISSFRKMVKTDYDWAMPAHNEVMVEKKVVQDVLTAIEVIKSGKAGTYKPGVANGFKVRRYDYPRFALIVRDE